MRNLGRNGAVIGHLDRLFRSGTSLGRSDGDLLQKFADQRDEAAFEALLLRFGPMVQNVCRQMLHDPRDVEDAFQATFLILARKAGSIRKADLLGNWLYGVAHKVAVRARSEAWRRVRRERSDSEPPEVPFESPDAAERAEARAILHEELGRLPEKYRAPVVLCHLQGYSHEEAARRLQWPVGTVRGRLARARDLLRDRLTRRGLAGSAMFAIAGLNTSTAKAAPFVSLTLVQATARLAIRSLGFRALATGAVPVAVATLTRGVSTAMLFTPWKIGITALVGAGIIGGGFAGAVARQDGEGRAPRPPEATIVEETTTVEQALPNRTVTIEVVPVDSTTLRHLSDDVKNLEARLQERRKEVEAQEKQVLRASAAHLRAMHNRKTRSDIESRKAEEQSQIDRIKAEHELDRVSDHERELKSHLEQAKKRLQAAQASQVDGSRVTKTITLPSSSLFGSEALRAELHQRQMQIQQAELDATRKAFEKANELHQLGRIDDSERIEAEIQVQKAEAALISMQLEALTIRPGDPTESQPQPTTTPTTTRPGSGNAQGVTLDLSGTLDRRLQEIERKLDLILERLDLEEQDE